METKRFQAPGGPALAYDEAGDRGATPVVLLHGFSASRGGWSWSGVTGKLSAEHHVFALDQRGHGDSEHTPRGYRLMQFTSDLTTFLEHVVGDPAVLVGHSLGGWVAAHVAGTRPELVRGAFFEDPPLWLTPAEFDGWSAREAAPGLQLLEQLLRNVHERQAPAEDLVNALAPLPMFGAATLEELLGAEGLQGFASALHRLDVDAIVGVLAAGFLDGYDPTCVMRCPVHVLRADPDRDAAFRPEHEAPFAAVHPHATIELVEGCGHVINIEQTDRFLSSLHAFLGGL